MPRERPEACITDAPTATLCRVRRSSVDSRDGRRPRRVLAGAQA